MSKLKTSVLKQPMTQRRSSKIPGQGLPARDQTVTSAIPPGKPGLALVMSAAERVVLGQCLVMSFAMACLVLTVPIFMLQLYDRIIPSNNTDTLLVLAVIACVLLAIFGLLDSLRGRLLLRVGAGMELRALAHAPLAASAQGDLDRLRALFQSGAPAALLDLPGLPIFLIVLAILHPGLAWLALGVAFVLMAVSILSGYGQRAQQAKTQPLDHLFDGSERLWLSPLQAVALERANGNRAEQRMQELGRLDRRARLTAALKSLRLAAQIACLALGGYFAMTGSLAPAAIVAATIIMSRALSPIEQLAGGWPRLIDGWRAWQRLKTLPQESESDPEMPVDQAPDIHLDQAVITAPGLDRPILRGIDLRLLPGTSLGVIGNSAAGKTALLRAIAGQWPLRFGRVQIGGRDPRTLSPTAHREAIGIVEQSPILVAGTIAENIASFRQDADAPAILAAARAAGIHQAILAEPDGYGRQVGPRGTAVTTALRAGIALAQALYDEPAILLLDAPFAGLDVPATARLRHALHQWLNPHRTIIITAHSARELGQTSHLLVLGDGLIQAGGRYAEVANWLQARAQKLSPTTGLPANQIGSPQQLKSIPAGKRG